MVLSSLAATAVYLIAAHYICDYPLQGDWLSKAKNPKIDLVGEKIWPMALFGHSLIHAVAVQLITGSWILFALELIIHNLTDWAKCNGWFGYNIDQSIHIGTKIIFVVLLCIFGVII